MNRWSPANVFWRFRCGLPAGVISLRLPTSSICFKRALLSAVGFTGALPLRCMAFVLVLWPRLCTRLPVIVGGVLLLGGESGVGVCTSSSSARWFECPVRGAGSASDDPIVCVDPDRRCGQQANVAVQLMRESSVVIVENRKRLSLASDSKKVIARAPEMPLLCPSASVIAQPNHRLWSSGNASGRVETIAQSVRQ